jgi:hypothetical protein
VLTDHASRIDSASIDVSDQFADQSRAFYTVLIVLGIGGVLVEVLSWDWIRLNSPTPAGVYAVGLLLLIAAVVGAMFAFVYALLREHAIRAIRVDETGVHLMRFRGRSIDLSWDDPAFRIQFRERTIGPAVQSNPGTEFLDVVGRGFPSDMDVPYRVYELVMGAAHKRLLVVDARPEAHRGRFGQFYWWVTTIRARQ